MTDDELRELVASIAVIQKENADIQKENAKQQTLTEEKIRQTEEQMQRTDERLERKLDRVSELLGNIGKNQGDVAEEFFYNSLIKDNHLGKIKFDDITKNMEKHRGKIQEEYDIFLTNGDAIAIIEVKYKAHVSDVDKLDRKFNNFKKLFPIYQDYKLYGALAAFHINDDAKQEVLKRGYFALQRNGELISSENSDFLKVA